MSKYQSVFFDLDHTLWDFDTNAKTTLFEIFESFGLQSFGIPSAENFCQVFMQVNDELWLKYDRGAISKFYLRDERFKMVLDSSGYQADEQLAKKINKAFMTECPQKEAVLDGALELLEYLQHKYALHIITNGFIETQSIKLTRSGLLPYFDKIITSEKAGFRKPNPGIFKYAMKHCQATPEYSIMIGDNLLTDIAGARNFGMDYVYFNPNHTTTGNGIMHEINHLKDLLQIL